MKTLRLSLTGFLTVLAAAPALHAQTVWNASPADDQWLNQANWTPADVPDTNTELAEFGASAIQNVTAGSPVTVKRITFNAASGTYTLEGSGLTVDVALAGTGTGTAVQMVAGAGTATINQLLTMNDAGGGNDSSLQILLGAGCTLNCNGGVVTASNRNYSVAGDGVLNVFTSTSSGTGQIQHNGNATLNLHVNPSASGQIRSFSNNGGGIRLHSNNTRALGLGVTGSTSHTGRIFLAAGGITTSGALTTTGATIAGTHSLDTTFGVDIPGAGAATHSGTATFGTLTGSAANSGNSWLLRLAAADDDTLTMSGVMSGFPTGYATPLISKTGPGTVIMSGANTHTVPMEVAAGTLTLTPAQTGIVPMTVQDGATLGVRLASAGTTLNFASLNTSSGGGLTPSVLWLQTGSTGNPTAPLLDAGACIITGPTTLRLSGTLTAAPGAPFPVMSYASLGGLGFGGISLALPFRASGSLVDDSINSRILVELTSAGGITWQGTVSGDWDVDTAGDGSTGTANWSAATGPNTYVQSGSGTTDSVTFDDSATGPSTVVLTTTLTPAAVTVNNTSRNYTLTGAGKLSGTTGITKTGTGSLLLINTGSNDNTGANSINGGTVSIGDGTEGAGSLGGSIAVQAGGTLQVNRPDGVTLGALSGDGAVELLSGETTFSGGSFTGVISGGGSLRSTAGLVLTGTLANTNTALTTIAGGQLQLNRPGVNAIGGDLLITGGATLSLQAAEQIPDTATITFTGTSTDSVPAQTASETIARVIVNPPVATGQFIMRQNMNVTTAAEARSGILGIASGHTASAQAIALSAGAIVRIAGSSGNSVLNVGTGGITADGGDIQVKFNANNFDAMLNLGGDFTATGNVTFSNAGYNGASLNVINLTGTRTFHIAAGTVTTVAPDLGDLGGLTKTGDGSLVLLSSCTAAHAGPTQVNGGALVVDGSITSGSVTVGSGGTLAGSGTISPSSTVQNGGSISAGGTAPGTLSLGADLTLAAGSTWVADITSAVTSDRLAVTGSLTASGTIKPVLTGYAPVEGDTFDLADAASITGGTSFDFSAAVLTPGLTWDTSAFATDGSIKVVAGANPYNTWAADKGLTPLNNAMDDDPDLDGVINAFEFYLDGNPLAGDAPRITVSLAPGHLRLTYRRRDDAETLSVTPESSNALAAAVWTPLEHGVDGVTITIAENGAAPDDVEILIPVTDARRFARLRLTFP